MNLNQFLRTEFKPFHDTASIERTLERLQLPVPQEGEFIHGNMGAIFFHPKAGVVIRIETSQDSGKSGLAKHPLIAEPLGKVVCNDHWQIEVCEGLRTSEITPDLVLWTRAQLMKDRIFWADSITNKKSTKCLNTDAHLAGVAKRKIIRCDNLGRLPLPTEQFPSGLPVVLDRGHVQSCTSSPFLYPSYRAMYQLESNIKAHFNAVAPRCHFEDFGVSSSIADQHRAIRQTLSQLFKPDDAGSMRAFWAYCEALTNPISSQPLPGALYRGWDAPLSPQMAIYKKATSAQAASRTLRIRMNMG